DAKLVTFGVPGGLVEGLPRPLVEIFVIWSDWPTGSPLQNLPERQHLRAEVAYSLLFFTFGASFISLRPHRPALFRQAVVRGQQIVPALAKFGDFGEDWTDMPYDDYLKWVVATAKLPHDGYGHFQGRVVHNSPRST